MRLLASLLVLLLAAAPALAAGARATGPAFYASAQSWRGALSDRSYSGIVPDSVRGTELLGAVLARTPLSPRDLESLSPAQKRQEVRDALALYARETIDEARATDGLSPMALHDLSSRLNELAILRHNFRRQIPREVFKLRAKLSDASDRRVDELLAKVGRGAEPAELAELAGALAGDGMRTEEITRAFYGLPTLPPEAFDVLESHLGHQVIGIRELIAPLADLDPNRRQRVREAVAALQKREPNLDRLLRTRKDAVPWTAVNHATLFSMPPAERLTKADVLEAARRSNAKRWTFLGGKQEFEAFLERAARYTDSPRRLFKTVDSAFRRAPLFGRAKFWSRRLPDPEGQRKSDFEYGEKTLAALKEQLPEIIRSVAQSMPDAGLTGFLIVGGLVRHPAPRRDLDLVPVSRRAFTASEVDRANEIVRERLLRRFDFDHIDVLQWTSWAIEAGTLGFQRHLATGAIYVAAAVESKLKGPSPKFTF